MRALRLSTLSTLLLVAGTTLALPDPVRAQDTASVAAARASSTSPVFDSRAELEERRERLESELGAVEAGSDARDSLRRRLVRVDRRLRVGDFQPGNIVELRVPGYDTLSGRFQVTPERSVEVPTIGTLDLAGVLFAEADSVIGGWLRQFVRAESVRIRVLQRIAVLGEVQSPGFYDLSPAAPLSEAVMAAGGPTQQSDLDEVEIRRDGRTLTSAEGRPLDEATSLEELGLERGDQIYVPRRSGGFGVSSVIGVIGALATLSFAASQLF